MHEKSTMTSPEFYFTIKILFYYLICVYVCLLYVYGCPWKPEEGIKSAEAGVTGGC